MIPKKLVIEVFRETGEEDIFDLIGETGLYIAGCAKKEEAEAIKLRYNTYADQQAVIEQLVDVCKLAKVCIQNIIIPMGVLKTGNPQNKVLMRIIADIAVAEPKIDNDMPKTLEDNTGWGVIERELLKFCKGDFTAEIKKRYNTFADRLKQKADLVLENNKLKGKFADQQVVIKQLVKACAAARESNPEPCQYDLHGDCQTHNLQPAEECWAKLVDDAIAAAEKMQ